MDIYSSKKKARHAKAKTKRPMSKKQKKLMKKCNVSEENHGFSFAMQPSSSSRMSRWICCKPHLLNKTAGRTAPHRQGDRP